MYNVWIPVEYKTMRARHVASPIIPQHSAREPCSVSISPISSLNVWVNEI